MPLSHRPSVIIAHFFSPSLTLDKLLLLIVGKMTIVRDLVIIPQTLDLQLCPLLILILPQAIVPRSHSYLCVIAYGPIASFASKVTKVS